MDAKQILDYGTVLLEMSHGMWSTKPLTMSPLLPCAVVFPGAYMTCDRSVYHSLRRIQEYRLEVEHHVKRSDRTRSSGV